MSDSVPALHIDFYFVPPFPPPGLIDPCRQQAEQMNPVSLRGYLFRQTVCETADRGEAMFS